MTLNRVKLGRAVTFTKYLASVISLIFIPKNLIWNKTTFPASYSLNFTNLVENELMESISKKCYRYSFFYPIYRCLFIVKIFRAYNYRTRRLYKNRHQHSLFLIMNYQSSNFGREGR